MTLKRLVKAYLVILLSIVFPGEFHFSIGNSPCTWNTKRT